MVVSLRLLFCWPTAAVFSVTSKFTASTGPHCRRRSRSGSLRNADKPGYVAAQSGSGPGAGREPDPVCRYRRVAWHRGYRYGTLIVNLDTHRPLVLLPGREQRTPAAWFKKYPEIQVVSRDHGGIYALTARDGAPQTVQVTGCWHLLKNIGDVLERMMCRHMPLIRQVATELSPKKRDAETSLVPVSTLRHPERIKR